MPRGLMDAGVVLRVVYSKDPMHARIRAELLRLTKEGWDLCYAAQGYRESWNVLTRPVDNGGYGVSANKAAELLLQLDASFTFLEETPEVFRQWRRLAQTYGLVGKSVHDANVVATALAHGVTEILTLNERDFRRYAEVSLIVP